MINEIPLVSGNVSLDKVLVNDGSADRTWELIEKLAERYPWVRGINLMRNLAISVGVENVFDKDYEPHLSGINRVANSDVAVGDRVPGPGRNYFATLQYKYD